MLSRAPGRTHTRDNISYPPRFPPLTLRRFNRDLRWAKISPFRLLAIASKRNGEIFAQRKSRLKRRSVKGGKRGGYEMLSLVCVRPGALDSMVRPRDLARLKQMEFEQGAALIRLGNPW